MTDSRAILAAVPVRNRKVLLEPNQDVQDIIKCITHYHRKYTTQYDQFAYRFDVGDERDIARELFHFCKDNIEYEEQPKAYQSVRSPGRILSEGVGDCKHYASFIAGVLDSLKRSGLDLDWAYRFSKYENPWTGKINNHVFVVLRRPNGKEIWIDPVLNSFDYHLPYKSATTRTINTLPKNEQMGCVSSFPCSCSCSRMGAAGDQYMPIPSGYPTNIPRPVLTADHKLVLRDNYQALVPAQIAWVQKALQPLIIQYAAKPYNIYWSIHGWGSGAGDIFLAGSHALQAFLSTVPEHDFLQYPPQPGGLDNFLIGLNDIMPALIGAGANAVVPGSGGIASSIVGSQTASADGNSAVTLSPAQLQAYNQSQSQTQFASLLPGISSGNLLPWGLVAAGIYFLTRN